MTIYGTNDFEAFVFSLSFYITKSQTYIIFFPKLILKFVIEESFIAGIF